MAGFGKWLLRIGLGFLAFVLVVGAIGWLWEGWAEARDERRFPAQGRMVDVGAGRRLIFCEGQGAPTVVLESGGGDPSLLLRPSQDRVARFARVCAYDRAGVGWSEPAPHPLNVVGQAAELRTLLANAGETGPFVLVGHSFGGIIVRQVAKDAPRDVAGMVLVDSVEEGFLFSPWSVTDRAAGVEDTRRTVWLARLGVVRVLFALDPGRVYIPLGFSNDQRRKAMAIFARPSSFSAGAGETANAYKGMPADMLKPGGSGSLGSMPLVVIRHGRAISKDAAIERAWAQAQARLAALSTDSREIVATKNGHIVSEENPDLVAGQIQAVVSAVRGHAPLIQHAAQPQ